MTKTEKSKQESTCNSFIQSSHAPQAITCYMLINAVIKGGVNQPGSDKRRGSCHHLTIFFSNDHLFYINRVFMSGDHYLK